MTRNPVHAGDWERELPELMVRYQEADAEAVAELISLLEPRLMRYFAATCVSRKDAEDLFQECWMRIHRSRHTYRSPAPVLPWVFAIARHTNLDGNRRRRRRDAREVLVADPPDTMSGAPHVEADNSELMRLLATLPERQREVVLMLKVSEMSLEEVARATGLTVGAVKQRAHRAYAKLRTLLNRERN